MNRFSNLGVGIAIGISIGVALGVAMDNIGVGIAIGVAIGVGLGKSFERRQAPITSKQRNLMLLVLFAGFLVLVVLLLVYMDIL